MSTIAEFLVWVIYFLLALACNIMQTILGIIVIMGKNGYMLWWWCIQLPIVFIVMFMKFGPGFGYEMSQVSYLENAIRPVIYFFGSLIVSWVLYWVPLIMMEKVECFLHAWVGYLMPWMWRGFRSNQIPNKKGGFPL